MAGEWDGERLGQLLTNLLGNALRHGSPAQPVQLQVDGTRADQVRLVICNAGCIPPELLPVLFQPFRGGESRNGRQDGLGLGLFIVSKIVDSHHGRITVCSEAGQTCFTVSLPRHAAHVTSNVNLPTLP